MVIVDIMGSWFSRSDDSEWMEAAGPAGYSNLTAMRQKLEAVNKDSEVWNVPATSPGYQYQWMKQTLEEFQQRGKRYGVFFMNDNEHCSAIVVDTHSKYVDMFDSNGEDLNTYPAFRVHAQAFARWAKKVKYRVNRHTDNGMTRMNQRCPKRGMCARYCVIYAYLKLKHGWDMNTIIKQFMDDPLTRSGYPQMLTEFQRGTMFAPLKHRIRAPKRPRSQSRVRVSPRRKRRVSCK